MLMAFVISTYAEYNEDSQTVGNYFADTSSTSCCEIQTKEILKYDTFT